MKPNPSFRDIEKLSAYLDGQLKASEVARLETRLQTEPELASVLKDLRQARGILRQLPQRRAPRNFTLTPKMVGLKPPMPRAYPVFRLATVLATLFLFFTFATNFMAPRMERVSVPYGIGGGYGGGGGGGADEPGMAMQSAPADENAEPEAPAAEAPMMEEPAATEEAPAPPAPEALAPEPTGEAATADDSARVEPTMVAPEGENLQQAAPEEPFAQKSAPTGETMQTPTTERRVLPFGGVLQLTLAVIAILSAIITFSIRYLTIRKWRAKAK